MRITGLSLFPVKSMGGVDLTESVVTPLGLEGDRRWAVLDEQGRTLTSLERAVLFGVRATPTPAGVRLDRGEETVEVAVPALDAPMVATTLSRMDRLRAADPGASRWLSGVVGREVVLVHQGDDLPRSVSEGHGGRPGDRLSLADTNPLHLVTESSVDRLRDWVTETQGEEWLAREDAVRRFRANLVVDGEEPFAEDGWQRLRVGATTYRLGELCDRCTMTTVDRDLATTKEPIRTLARHRRWDGATWFGVRLVPELDGPSSIAVGDEVEVLPAGS
ncbi:MOSC domain-containing protein [Nocardioides marmoribigeumensis]|uniref:Uncharacterized protein YcbX n=1 Tax=Nocardioides marmoribigeumensis TaxID=433649 RepID=A0ABU2BYK3_9ACTN|nr:MOSC domain-containing protein [Nocardioides marmoribigeumensis]MDR7363487.1 uncharacterized protein YcbX [Nocardioides marmoribigeumensis]